MKNLLRLLAFGAVSLLALDAAAQVVYSGVNLVGKPKPADSIGVENSWYLDLTSGNVYGPKNLGRWPDLPVGTLQFTQSNGAILYINAPNNGTDDATANIQSALDYAADNGLSSYLPAGSYKVSGNLVTKSGTNLSCSTGATIYQQWDEATFVNPNALRNWATDYTPATRANATDHNITISGCTDDHTQASSTLGPYSLLRGTFAYLLAQDLHFTNNRTIGDSTGVVAWRTVNQTRLQKVFDSNADYNYGVGLFNMVGIWGGSQNVSATFNTGFLAPNITNANAFSCSNINGAGGAPGDHQITSQITYANNTCYAAGGDNAHGGMVAYNNGALSSGSQLNDFTFANNRTYASGTNNVCFDAKGSIDGWRITGNYFKGCDKVGTYPVVYAGLNLGPRAVGWTVAPDPFTTTSGSSLVSASISGVSTLTVSVGNYVAISSSTVGGLTLAGFYPITSVGTNTFTFDAGATASSSTTGGGSPTIATYWGTVRDSIISQNYFENDNATNTGMVTVAGPNNIIENNIVDGGTYGSITLTSYFDCCSANTPIPINLSGNNGPIGSGVHAGIFGWTVKGDAYNSYQFGYPPDILDYALVDTWTPSPRLNNSAVGITGTFAGTWFRSGSVIQACASLIFSNLGAGAAGDVFTISGLPFSPVDGVSFPFQLTKATNFTPSGSGGAFNESTVRIQTPGGTAPTLALFTDATLSTQLTRADLQNNTNLYFCGTYQTPGRD